MLMQVPKKLVLDEEEGCRFWMKRHAVVTEDLVNKLIAALSTVKFKKGKGNLDSSVDHINTSERMKKAAIKKDSSGKEEYYAYVHPNDLTRTIYLCEMFWKAHEYLEKDSQPGTLIHEVSHFLGTYDLTYEESTLFAGCKGHRIRASPENSSSSQTEENIRKILERIGLSCINKLRWQGKPDNVETYCYNALGEPVWNANNIEYEFELTLKHKGIYRNGKYFCCGEREQYSVCVCSVPDNFHTCDSEEKIDKVDRKTFFESVTIETTYFTPNSRTQPRQARMRALLLEPRQTQLIPPPIKMPSQSRHHGKRLYFTSSSVTLKTEFAFSLHHP
nr:PREDICTED: uncharacterized protein LOC107983030 [Anolis carolinensis]|eukprot:XP_016850229.1 PREDICTED: uncharacterized protein LOC107983030 [Anolis carolinensis]